MGSKVKHHQHLLSHCYMTQNDEYVVMKRNEVEYFYTNNEFFKIVWYCPAFLAFVLSQIVTNIVLMAFLFKNPFKYSTIFFTYFLMIWSTLGVTAGSHRLWTHRSYKAKIPLQIFYIIGHTLSWQFSILRWSVYHVVHHKYSDTDADPHNIKRGMLFAHIGHLFKRTHPSVYEESKNIDVSWLANDKFLQFQHKYYYTIFLPLFAVFMPTCVYYYVLEESYMLSVAMIVFRSIMTLHGTFCINSFAHVFGDKPYKRNIQAGDSHLAALGGWGEGYHNYHHTFPFDYATSEFGYKINPTKVFIDFMFYIGQAYDLKRPTKELVDKTKQKTLTITQKCEH